MLRNCLLILAIGLLTMEVSGQSFSFDPGADYEKSVSASGYSSHTIYMENLTGDELVLGWEMLSNDLPAAWKADLCDYISCYIGIPEDGVMMAISDTTRGFLKIILNPNDKVGMGTVVFRVFDNKYPENTDTCTFVLQAGELTSVGQQAGKENITFYPVPATDYLTVETEAAFSGAILEVIDMRGQLQLARQFFGMKETIPVQHLPKGMYFIRLSGKQGIIERGKVLIH